MTTLGIPEDTLHLTISLAEVTQLRSENAALKAQVSALQNEIAELKNENELLKKKSHLQHSFKKHNRSAQSA